MGYITYNNVLAIKSTAAVGKIPMFVEMVLNFVPVRLSLWNLKLIINILVLQKLPGILYLKYIIISNTILNNIKIRKDVETTSCAMVPLRKVPTFSNYSTTLAPPPFTTCVTSLVLYDDHCAGTTLLIS